MAPSNWRADRAEVVPPCRDRVRIGAIAGWIGVLGWIGGRLLPKHPLTPVPNSGLPIGVKIQDWNVDEAPVAAGQTIGEALRKAK